MNSSLYQYIFIRTRPRGLTKTKNQSLLFAKAVASMYQTQLDGYFFFFFFFLGAAPTDCTQDLTPGQQLSNGECSTGVQLAT